MIESSPSPAGSLNNSSDNLTAHDDSDLTESMSTPENDTIIIANINQSSPLQLTDSSKPIMSLKDYLHALDRHKSIDNCFLSPSNADRLYFYDEIKKITNHLFKITAQAEPHMNDGGDAEKHGIQLPVNRVHDMNTQNLSTMQTTTNDIATESNTFKESDGVDVKNVKMCDGSLDSNNNKINDYDEGKKGDDYDDDVKKHPFSEILKKFSSLASDGGTDLSNAPWRHDISTKRTKFRINQMSSRDVPIYKTEKPGRLQKQNAIDACDTKLFDEKINHRSIFHNTSSAAGNKNSIVNLLESFEHDKNQLFQSHIRHKTFIDRMPNESISFDCGQLGIEQRAQFERNTIRSLFQMHASTGRNVKQIQAKIEAKNNWISIGMDEKWSFVL